MTNWEICLVVFVYFTPWILSLLRKESESTPIFFVNLLLGWTGIMWLWCIGAALIGKTDYESATVPVDDTTDKPEGLGDKAFLTKHIKPIIDWRKLL
jgi:hypothetical protein